MPSNYRKLLIVSVTFLSGLYFFLEYLLPEEFMGINFGHYHSEIINAVRIISAMAIGLGIINILKVHGIAILKSRPGWTNSVALILGLFFVLAVSGRELYQGEERLKAPKTLRMLSSYVEVIKKEEKDKPPLQRTMLLTAELEKLGKDLESGSNYLRKPDEEASFKTQQSYKTFKDALENSIVLSKNLESAYRDNQDSEEAGKSLVAKLKIAATSSQDVTLHNFKKTESHRYSEFVFKAFYTPLGAAMFSLLAFYIANAAYRSFRVKTLEATVMMVAAIIVMLGQIPFGPLYISEDLPAIRLWIIEKVSTPAFRAIFFGSAIAGLAMAVRMWLSLEKSPLVSEEDS